MFVDEKMLTLSEAAKKVPGGTKHISALWRWSRKGIKTNSGNRVRLEHIRVGAKLFTSKQALVRFFKAVADDDIKHFAADASENTTAVDPTPAQREKEIADADRRLAAAGI